MARAASIGLLVPISSRAGFGPQVSGYTIPTRRMDERRCRLGAPSCKPKCWHGPLAEASHRADTILSKIRFPTPPARKSAMTVEHVEAIRKTAHTEGWPSIALATVLQFELALRQKQKDVIGEWEPAANVEGGITHRDTRWVNG